MAVFFSLGILQGQKLVKRTVLGSRADFYEIDAGDCYRISLRTGTSDQVEVRAQMDGEYAQDLMLHVEEKGGTISIRADFLPAFVNPNDKLSAHKVVSISLEISLPVQKRVRLRGTDCHVWATGDYELLEIDLDRGSCHLEALTKSVRAKTLRGDIWLTTERGDIRAHSDYGRVHGEEIPWGDADFMLHSQRGDIHIQKPK